MQDFPAANGSNIRLLEREQGNGSAISGNKLYLESRTIFVTVHYCPYITSFKAVFGHVMRKNNCI